MTVGDNTDTSVIWFPGESTGKTPGGVSEDTPLPVTVLRKTVTLTDAQIKALPTTSIEVIPAPDEGSTLVFIGGTALMNRTAGAYTNVDSSSYIFLAQSSSGFDVSNKFGDFNLANREGTLTPALQEEDDGYLPATISHMAGEGIAISMVNSLGDLTGGNAANTLKITVIYTIVDL